MSSKIAHIVTQIEELVAQDVEAMTRGRKPVLDSKQAHQLSGYARALKDLVPLRPEEPGEDLSGLTDEQLERRLEDTLAILRARRRNGQ